MNAQSMVAREPFILNILIRMYKVSRQIKQKLLIAAENLNSFTIQRMWCVLYSSLLLRRCEVMALLSIVKSAFPGRTFEL